MTGTAIARQKNIKSLMFHRDLKYLRPLVTSCLNSNAPTDRMISTAFKRLREKRTSLPILSSDKLRHEEEIRINANSVNVKPRIMLYAFLSLPFHW
jgi:hypothetical protein